MLRQRRGAAGSGLGTTTKYLRRTSSGAAGSSLGTTSKYLCQTTSGAAGKKMGRSNQVPATKKRAAPRATAGHHDGAAGNDRVK
jgi:hypothetical protein